MISKSIFATMIAVLGVAGSIAHAEEYLPAIGGDGGAQFRASCPSGQNLTGFELRVGDDVDAIRPVCVLAYGPGDISAAVLTTGTGLMPPIIFKAPKLVPGWYGGPGGNIGRLLCPASTPIVIGVDIAAEGVDHVVVNNIHLFCGLAVTNQTPAANPSAILDAPGYHPSQGAFGLDGKDARVRTGSQRCPAGQVATGVHGRYGVWLDAMGLICDAPRMTKPPVILGRVGGTHAGTPAPPPKRMGDEPLICARARDARARKAPTAAALEARCRAAGGSFTDRAVAPVRSGTSAISAPARSRAGIFAPPPAAPPAAQPPAEPEPADSHAFVPPTFADGARLWACANAAQGKAKGAACSGKKAGKAYCRMQGFPGGLQPDADGGRGVVVKPVRPGSRVRALNGDVCTADDCVAITELHCSP